MIEIGTKVGGLKRLLNRLKVPKTRDETSIRPKTLAPQTLGTQSSETLINRDFKNPKHGKHASQVGDGYLTVRDSEVLISLEFKIGQIIFLKGPKKGKIRPLKNT
jgi:hypothetical protein